MSHVLRTHYPILLSLFVVLSALPVIVSLDLGRGITVSATILSVLATFATYLFNRAYRRA